jgi:hypothetical protein
MLIMVFWVVTPQGHAGSYYISEEPPLHRADGRGSRLLRNTGSTYTITALKPRR